MTIPLFEATGFLQPGRHPSTPTEIRTRLVDPFGQSVTRADLMDGWLRRRADVSAIVPIEMEWVNGSFVTEKLDPADIDVATFVRADFVDALTLTARQRLSEIVMGPVCRATYRCDAYFVPVFPRNHGLEPLYHRWRGYWDAQWSFDRSGVEKGFLDVRSDP